MLKKIFYDTALSISILMFVVLISLPTPLEKLNSTAKLSNTRPLLIKNALVFTGESRLLNQDIEISEGVIKNIGNDLTSNTAKTVNAHGKVLIPGLIDAHTHSFANALNNALNFGVATHVDMFTHPSILLTEKEKRVNIFQSSEADLFSAGMLATIDGGHGTQFGLKVETINSPDQAKKWVERRAKEGSDFIKIVYMPYSNYFKSIDRATAAAIIEAAHDLNLQALAHVSTQRAAQELLEDGIDGLVHVFADEKISDEFMQLAKSKNIFVIPTLSVIASVANEDLGAKLADNPLIKAHLKPGQYQQLQSTYGNQNIPGFELSIALYNVKKLHQNGITILAGSDAANPGTTYGATVHQELQLLIRAGLTPREALNAATIKVAEKFDLVDRGQIKIGMKADLILLNSNPLTNITATRDIDSIYKNGQLVHRETRSSQTRSKRSASHKIPQNPEGLALSNFANSLESSTGFTWTKNDDTLAGGKSNASISVNQQVLSVDTAVNSGFIFPWAGAGAFTQQAIDISAYTRLQFKVRGTNAGYQVMVFSGAQAGVPPSQLFDATKTWQTISLDLKNFKGLDASNFFGLAIVAGPTQGQFKYQLDDVKLLP